MPLHLIEDDGVPFASYRGDFDASAGTLPSGANAGDFYYVTTAGTIGTATLAVGDVLVAKTGDLTTATDTTVGNFDTNWFVVGSTSGAEATFDVSQTGHGLTLPTEGFVPVYLDSSDGNWKAAIASAETTFAQAYVVAVPDANSLTLQQAGVITATAHGLTVGAIQYLDAGVAGSITTTAPTNQNVVAIAIDANQILLVERDYRVEVSTDFYTQTFNATTDWTLAAPYYEITVPAATHGITSVASIITYEDSAGDLIVASPDQTVLSATGDVTIRVADVPDNRFAGTIRIYDSATVAAANQATFVVADWTGPVAGEYSVNIPSGTHGVATPVGVQVFEGTTAFTEAFPEQTIIEADNSITLVVESVPDSRFDGKIVVF